MNQKEFSFFSRGVLLFILFGVGIGVLGSILQRQYPWASYVSHIVNTCWFFAGVGFIIFVTFRHRRSNELVHNKNPNEANSKFSQIGGAMIGWMNYSWPFAMLSIGPEALHLSCLGQDYTFPKNRIEALTRYRWLFSFGLRIHHTILTYPDFIVFWVSLRKRRFRILKAKLEALGYEVLE